MTFREKKWLKKSIDKENCKPHILYMGIENGINAMENNLAVSLRVKNRFALCPNDFTSRYLSTQGKLKHMFTQNSTFEYS